MNLFPDHEDFVNIETKPSRNYSDDDRCPTHYHNQGFSGALPSNFPNRPSERSQLIPKFKWEIPGQAQRLSQEDRHRYTGTNY